ncbi:MAG TPA: 50S ribosomal protein L22 [Candidatus Omnitrophica bacterium]|nr:50S ribosomal protein L22 [Candidatus Omnitrophota bacterium]
MIAKAKLRFIRISPKKVKGVVDLIRGKHIQEALDILTNLNKRASKIIIDLLNSAINNAKQVGQNVNDLYVSKIIVNKGPFLKRYRAAAFGRAGLLRRRLSHIELELDRINFEKEKTESTSKEEDKKSKDK